MGTLKSKQIGVGRPQFYPTKKMERSHSYPIQKIKSQDLQEIFSNYENKGYAVGYPNQDSIYFYAIFHQENLKQDSLNIFPPKVSRYLSTLIISNCKFKITTITQISLQDNLITLNLIIQQRLFLTLEHHTSASSILEQSRLHQKTQLVMSKCFTIIICN